MKESTNQTKKEIVASLDRPTTVRALAHFAVKHQQLFPWATTPQRAEKELRENEQRRSNVLEHYRLNILHELLDHYGIGRDLQHRWTGLAWHLANDHVPAFQFVDTPKRGRPPNGPPKFKNNLWRLAFFSHPFKKRRGAPTKWGINEYRTLLELVAQGAALLNKRGARVTNISALEAIYLEWNTKGNFNRSTSEIRTIAKEDSRRISDAKKALRKISQ